MPLHSVSIVNITEECALLKGQFHGFAHVQALSLAVVNFTVS